MNLEGLTLKLLTDTLNTELLGSKIYRVFMPGAHSLLLLVRRAQDTSALLGDMGGGSGVLYIPAQLPQNPDVPPAFCMLLRKHLEEGRITKISQSGLDRIITLEVDLLGVSSKIITKKLIFELTGKNSNIILTQDDVIIDALRHVSAAQSSYRTILPGRPYVAPAAGRPGHSAHCSRPNCAGSQRPPCRQLCQGVYQRHHGHRQEHGAAAFGHCRHPAAGGAFG